jgi:putative DNA primase/helicase
MSLDLLERFQTIRDGAEVEPLLRPVELLPWPEPRPLEALRPSVPPLEAALLPPAFRPWLLDCAEELSVPLELLAAPAIVGLSAVVGRGIGVRPKARGRWLVTPNLWGVNVAPPGMKKSAVLGAAFGPLHRVAGSTRKKLEADLVEFGPIAAALAARRKAAEKGLEVAAKADMPEDLDRWKAALGEVEQEERERKPAGRRFVLQDGTVERIGMLLAEPVNARGLLVLRDELPGWLRSLDREDRSGDRPFYLEGWAGDSPFAVARVSRPDLHVEALCLSIFGGCQPGPLAEVVKEALAGGRGNDGLLPRFQVVAFPDGIGDYHDVDRPPDRAARERVDRIFERLAELPASSFGAVVEEAESSPTLRFETEAADSFRAWLVGLEGRLRSVEVADDPALGEALSKFRSLVPSLALLDHLVAVADGLEPGPVRCESLDRALGLARFFEAGIRKILSLGRPGVDGAEVLLERIRSGRVRDGEPIREIYLRGWTGLGEARECHAAAERLAAAGWVRVERREPPVGAPSHVLRLHPSLTGGRA